MSHQEKANTSQGVFDEREHSGVPCKCEVLFCKDFTMIIVTISDLLACCKSLLRLSS